MPNLNESCGNLQLNNPFLNYVKRNSPENSTCPAPSNHIKSILSQCETSRGIVGNLSLLPAPEGFEAVREAIDILRVEALDSEELAAAVLSGWREIGPTAGGEE